MFNFNSNQKIYDEFGLQVEDSSAKKNIVQ